jgi:carbon-monoxide dehydrogenase medium subunit
MINASSMEEVLDILAERAGHARIIAGATDLLLELERGLRPGIDTLVDVSRIPDLDCITLDEMDRVHLGPLVTHSHCVASKLIVERALPLAQAAVEVGAPQIRNRGTIAGNLITASPANDTIGPLIALGAEVTLRSRDRGERSLRLEDFYLGVRQTAMAADEMLTNISFPAMTTDQRGMFVKLGLRRAQAISVVYVALILRISDEVVREARITLGSVSPRIINAEEAEEFLPGRKLTTETIQGAADLAALAARPIDDVRSSANYRREMVRVCVLRALRALAAGEERKNFPSKPVLLWGSNYDGTTPLPAGEGAGGSGRPIQTRINGKAVELVSGHHKTLLRLLREEAGLTGTKEGCCEGECGACTVFLDGMAVMSCLVPAARAHGAEIVTIEGLASDGHLHPLQQAFIEEGAVQCGYCTPGFIMSAAKLLEENKQPSVADIKQAISGNLCRCTGYYKIVSAIENATQLKQPRIESEAK